MVDARSINYTYLKSYNMKQGDLHAPVVILALAEIAHGMDKNLYLHIIT